MRKSGFHPVNFILFIWIKCLVKSLLLENEGLQLFLKFRIDLFYQFLLKFEIFGFGNFGSFRSQTDSKNTARLFFSCKIHRYVGEKIHKIVTGAGTGSVMGFPSRPQKKVHHFTLAMHNHLLQSKTKVIQPRYKNPYFTDKACSSEKYPQFS